MSKLIQFIFKKINFILFILLEIIALVLYFSNNAYQGAAFFNSSNAISGNLSNFSSYSREFIYLSEINSELSKENAKLRTLLLKNSTTNEMVFESKIDTLRAQKYKYESAKVINNSTNKLHNYLTINKGTQDSIFPGMGVVCIQGVVGKIKSSSKNYATITSILHVDGFISSKLKRNGAIGPLRWDGNDAKMAKLMYIPRHLEVKKGDTIVSSEHNSVFPEGEMIGQVSSIAIKGDENFYTLSVRLSTDFTKLSHVYVIKNSFKLEQDSLESLNSNIKTDFKNSQKK
ncbi:MAG: rod shape-determining protein MreC [Cytophagales bacterium]|nr:MAG: rod shape-determining protein MreC [Cytophagales bacterium]